MRPVKTPVNERILKLSRSLHLIYTSLRITALILNPPYKAWKARFSTMLQPCFKILLCTFFTALLLELDNTVTATMLFDYHILFRPLLSAPFSDPSCKIRLN